ncbi:MAG: hypothetical protein KBC11_01095 [Candidatus Pacebacteria bacterium]|nr:hypothetical protein [Candidatus Paceibacterota bacterium]
MKKIVVSLFVLALLVLPAAVSAQLGGPRPNFTYANTAVEQIIRWSQMAVTFLMIIATLWFIWTVIGYIRVKDATKAEDAKKAMIRGIIGLFVIVTIWGIVRILASTLGVTGGSLNTEDTPCPPGMTYSTLDRVCR